MESDHRQDSTDSSSEEVDQPNQDNNDVGTGRSYECVFCKRGFTTAQALGGHMNIHRKDRAKNRPALINSNKHEEIYASPRIYQPISSPPRYSAPHQEAQVSYRTYFPASTSGARPSSYTHHGNEFYGQIPHHLSPFGDDWRMSLSLQFGPAAYAEDNKEKKRDGSEEDELDLELRLGHNP